MADSADSAGWPEAAREAAVRAAEVEVDAERGCQELVVDCAAEAKGLATGVSGMDWEAVASEAVPSVAVRTERANTALARAARVVEELGGSAAEGVANKAVVEAVMVDRMAILAAKAVAVDSVAMAVEAADL